MMHLFLILKIVKKEKHRLDHISNQKQDNITCMVYRITARPLKLYVLRYYDVPQVLSFEWCRQVNSTDRMVHCIWQLLSLSPALLSIQHSCKLQGSKQPHHSRRRNPQHTHHFIPHYTPHNYTSHHTTTIHTTPLHITSLQSTAHHC